MEIASAHHELKKEIGLLDATMLVAGSMIGSGIFLVTSEMSRNVGSPGLILILWIVSGLITLIAALSYGELAGMMPQAGGQYIYLKEAFNPMVGFLFGWTVFTVIQTGVIAAVAIAFATYTGELIPWFSSTNIIADLGFIAINTKQVLAIFLISFLTFINLKGVRNGKLVQTFFTLAKLLALLGLICAGMYVGLNLGVFQANLVDFWKPYSTTVVDGVVNTHTLSGVVLWGAIGAAMVGSLFSLDSWNNITYMAGEVKNPQRNLPMSLFFGTLIVSILYVLANVTYMMLLPVAGVPDGITVAERGIMFANENRVGTGAASVIFGQSAIVIMALLIMVSTFGCNNGIILSGARLYYAMAKDGLFFKRAGVLNKYDVPGFALIVQAIWASVLCLSGTYGQLLDYCTFSSLLFYVVTIIGLFVLRKKKPDADRPYKAFGYPLLPFLYIVIAGAICVVLLIVKPDTCGWGLGIVLLGLPVYYVGKKSISE